ICLVSFSFSSTSFARSSLGLFHCSNSSVSSSEDLFRASAIVRLCLSCSCFLLKSNKILFRVEIYFLVLFLTCHCSICFSIGAKHSLSNVGINQLTAAFDRSQIFS